MVSVKFISKDRLTMATQQTLSKDSDIKLLGFERAIRTSRRPRRIS